MYDPGWWATGFAPTIWLRMRTAELSSILVVRFMTLFYPFLSGDSRGRERFLSIPPPYPGVSPSGSLRACGGSDRTGHPGCRSSSRWRASCTPSTAVPRGRVPCGRLPRPVPGRPSAHRGGAGRGCEPSRDRPER